MMKKVVNFLPYLFVFVSSLSYSRDPDLGWHLKYGEYFLANHQILKENIYSSTMVGYSWANGGWLSDVLIYFVFNSFGFLGLTVIGALVVSATFYFFSKAVNLPLYQKFFLFPVIAFCLESINASSFRGQQLTLLFLSILVALLLKVNEDYGSKKNSSKVIFLLPLLFFFWFNLHQESFLGLGVLFLWTIVSTLFKRDKEALHLTIIFVVSCIASLLTPFGIETYKVAISHVMDPLLLNVNEYIPFRALSINWWKLIVITIISLSGFIFITLNNKKSIAFRLGVILLFLLLLAFFVRRFSWPAFYLFIPFIGLLLSKFKFKFRYFLQLGFIFCVTLTIFVLNSKINYFGDGWENWNNYCKRQIVPCSPDGANYISKNLKNKKLFTYYDWGGWLIWNYPQTKPSIDGRMHLWRDKYGYSATEEYWNIESNKISISKTKFDAAFIPMIEGPLYYELNKLINEKKWKIVYQDEISAVVVRNINKKK